MTDGHKPEHISAGCVVKSLAGRDGGRLFVVSAPAGEGYIYITDGRTRKVEHPKKKKLRHVEYVASAVQEILQRLDQGRLTNSAVRKFLSELTTNEENRENAE